MSPLRCVKVAGALCVISKEIGLVDLESIDNKINRTTRLILLAAFAVPMIYGVWFVIHGQELSLETSDWGTFGDFIGGLLNPLVAFFAFYWLTQSIKIQKEELSETKTALQETSREQKKQTKLALKSFYLQSINMELEYLNSKIDAERTYINHLLQQAQIHGVQYTIITKTGVNEKLEKVLPSINEELSELEFQRNEVLNRLKSYSE